MTTKKFDTFALAFDYCREVDAPVKVYVLEGGRWNLYKVFPSGHADLIAQGPPPTGPNESMTPPWIRQDGPATYSVSRKGGVMEVRNVR